jgi:hypothetical protein
MQYEKLPSSLSDSTSLPAHCLNVFIPLIDLSTTPEAGGTVFIPGSHHDLTICSLESEAKEPGSNSGVGNIGIIF